MNMDELYNRPHPAWFNSPYEFDVFRSCSGLYGVLSPNDPVTAEMYNECLSAIRNYGYVEPLSTRLSPLGESIRLALTGIFVEDKILKRYFKEDKPKGWGRHCAGKDVYISSNSALALSKWAVANKYSESHNSKWHIIHKFSPGLSVFMEPELFNNSPFVRSFSQEENPWSGPSPPRYTGPYCEDMLDDEF